uniref:Uncharacterized protein n=1 Tax=Zea mays TaxID=4577 RepID=C4J2Y8_MAIZE|nr:unknown [Zea mays]
MSGVHCASP